CPHLLAALVRVTLCHPRRAGERDLVGGSRPGTNASRAPCRHPPRRLCSGKAAGAPRRLARATVGKARERAHQPRGPPEDRGRPSGSPGTVRSLAQGPPPGGARGGRRLLLSEAIAVAFLSTSGGP